MFKVRVMVKAPPGTDDGDIDAAGKGEDILVGQGQGNFSSRVSRQFDPADTAAEESASAATTTFHEIARIELFDKEGQVTGAAVSMQLTMKK
jgi:hypothetical protein